MMVPLAYHIGYHIGQFHLAEKTLIIMNDTAPNTPKHYPMSRIPDAIAWVWRVHVVGTGAAGALLLPFPDII